MKPLLLLQAWAEKVLNCFTTKLINKTLTSSRCKKKKLYVKLCKQEKEFIKRNTSDFTINSAFSQTTKIGEYQVF